VSWLKIVAYYALAAVLSLHLLGVWNSRQAARAPADGSATPFLEAVPERIDRVRIEKDAEQVVFERSKDGRWIVTEPEGIAPPGDVVDAVLESFTGLPAIEIVADGIEHEGQFGLVPPRARIRIEQQGTLVSTIVLGELSPTRTAVYAKKSGKDEVALIGLNAKYYLDLVFESVRRQRASAGVPAKPSTIPPAPESAPLVAPATAPTGNAAPATPPSGAAR
jgi:hypothetical protein